MKITDISTYPVWGGQRNFLFVVVDTDDGIYGVGEDGSLLAPEIPGLGIEFDREAAKAHPMRMSELPHLHRLDGSVTNW